MKTLFHITHTGQVIFYSKPKPAKNTMFNVQLILNGEQFGSSFGYTLIAIDVNGDKWVWNSNFHLWKSCSEWKELTRKWFNRKLDLVVGAPFFYNKSEGGAVYVYLNSPSGLRNDTFSVRLTGKPESRFGFALTSLGDINKVSRQWLNLIFLHNHWSLCDMFALFLLIGWIQWPRSGCSLWRGWRCSLRLFGI